MYFIPVLCSQKTFDIERLTPIFQTYLNISINPCEDKSTVFAAASLISDLIPYPLQGVQVNLVIK